MLLIAIYHYSQQLSRFPEAACEEHPYRDGVHRFPEVLQKKAEQPPAFVQWDVDSGCVLLFRMPLLSDGGYDNKICLAACRDPSTRFCPAVHWYGIL